MQKVVLKKPAHQGRVPAGTAGGVIGELPEKPKKGEQVPVQVCGLRLMLPLSQLEIVEGEHYA